MTTEAITLTIPGEREYFGVAPLVLGGLASRHRLTIEGFEDLLLALDGLLERSQGSASVTLSVQVDGDAIEAKVGPFEAGELRQELERRPDGGWGLPGVRDAVVDDVSIASEDGADWVRLTKTARSGGVG